MLFQTVRPLFIRGAQIKIFLMKSENILTLHRQHATDIFSKDIVKIVHVT